MDNPADSAVDSDLAPARPVTSWVELALESASEETSWLELCFDVLIAVDSSVIPVRAAVDVVPSCVAVDDAARTSVLMVSRLANTDSK